MVAARFGKLIFSFVVSGGSIGLSCSTPWIGSVGFSSIVNKAGWLLKCNLSISLVKQGFSRFSRLASSWGTDNQLYARGLNLVIPAIDLFSSFIL